MRVLVVDDDPVTVEIVAEQLLQCGYDVTAARDGAGPRVAYRARLRCCNRACTPVRTRFRRLKPVRTRLQTRFRRSKPVRSDCECSSDVQGPFAPDCDRISDVGNPVALQGALASKTPAGLAPRCFLPPKAPEAFALRRGRRGENPPSIPPLVKGGKPPPTRRPGPREGRGRPSPGWV